MCDINECCKGNHNFKIINRSGYDGMSEKVVRWCSVCGSIEIDADYDGRTNSEYYMKMKSPEFAKQYYNNEYLEKEKS